MEFSFLILTWKYFSSDFFFKKSAGERGGMEGGERNIHVSERDTSIGCFCTPLPLGQGLSQQLRCEVRALGPW